MCRKSALKKNIFGELVIFILWPLIAAPLLSGSLAK